jgi:tetratricopeptide (TPR) repeat protein
LSLDRISNLPDAYQILTFSTYLLGGYLEAQVYSQKGMDLAEKSHNWRMLGYLNGERALLDINLGNLGSALNHARKAVILGEQHQHVDVLSIGYRCLGDIYLYLKIHDQALKYYQMGIETSSEGFWGLDNLIRYGYTSCMMGKTEHGLSALRQVIGQARADGLEYIAIQGEIFEAAYCADLGPDQQLKENLTRLYYETSRRSLPMLNTAVLLLLGTCCAAEGDNEAAIHNYQTVVSRAAMLSHPWLEIAAQTALKKNLEERRKPTQAQSRRIETIVHQLDASLGEEESDLKQVAFRYFLQAST